MSRSARLISIEGIDSVGKSSHIERLRQDCNAREVPVTFVSDPPKHSPWDTLQDVFQRGARLSRASKAVLLLAARLDNNARCIARWLRLSRQGPGASHGGTAEIR